MSSTLIGVTIIYYCDGWLLPLQQLQHLWKFFCRVSIVAGIKKTLKSHINTGPRGLCCTVAVVNGWTPSTSKKTTSSSMRRQLLAWEFNPGRGRCEKFLPRLAYVFRSHSQSTGNDHFAMLLLRLLKWPSQISTLTRSSLTHLPVFL